MKKLCFLCETPLNLLNALRIGVPHLTDSEVVLYVRTEQIGKEIVERLRDINNGIRIIEFSYEKYYVWVNHKLSFGLYKYISIICPQLVYRGMVGHFCKEKYDEIYIAYPNPLQNIIYRMNYNLDICYFEDGIGNYLDFRGLFPPFVSLQDDIWYALHLKKNPWRHIKSIYLNTPYIADIDNIEKLQIPKVESNVEKIIAYVFNDSSHSNEDKRIIYFTNPIQDYPDNIEKKRAVKNEIISILKNTVGSNVLLRYHPRDKEIVEGISIDESKGIWEISCKDRISENSILIANISTAQFTPKLLYNREPYLIFLYKLFGDCENNFYQWEKFLYQFKKSYSAENKIYIPESMEEFRFILERIGI